MNYFQADCHWCCDIFTLTVLPHPHCQVFHNVLKEFFMTIQVPRCPSEDDTLSPGLIGGGDGIHWTRRGARRRFGPIRLSYITFSRSITYFGNRSMKKKRIKKYEKKTKTKQHGVIAENVRTRASRYDNGKTVLFFNNRKINLEKKMFSNGPAAARTCVC